MNISEVINKIEHLPKLHEKNDLTYIKRVLAELGNPQDQVKTIHVTGTNGKGSTSYYLANLLKKAGQKTGLFVSPYIIKFNERIQLNGEPIPDADLIAGYQVIEQAIAKIRQDEPDFSLVTFEFETALAFWYFAHLKCDYAVIEVGIGGSHDKTNVITPEVSVITTIGLDHEQIIGPTLADIAKEKSGVIKPKRPVVLGNIPTKVLPILEKSAAAKQAPVHLLKRDFFVEINQEQISCRLASCTWHFNLRPTVESYDIAVALQAFSLLKLPLNKNQVRAAIDETVIPGRYQVLQQRPRLILDGAHNIQAMSQLLAFVRQTNKGQLYFLVGMMKDKDLKQVFDLFSPNEHLLLTRIDYPRAAKLKDFPLTVQKRAKYYADYQTAFTEIYAQLQPTDTLVVTGSFYLVGAILNYWSKQYEGKKH